MASNSDRRSASSAASRSRTRPGEGRSKELPSLGEQLAKRKRAEREQRRVRARRGTVLRVVLLVALVAGAIAGVVAVYRSPFLTVRRYRLVGAKQLKLEQVLARAKVPVGATLIRFPSAEVRDRIAQDPWVSAVTVHRKLPDTVEFDIVERVPAALLDAGGSLWLLDGDGWVLAQRSADASGVLPVIRKVEGVKPPKVGARLPNPPLHNALAVLAGISPELRREVRFVEAPTVDETGLLTKQNVDILMGTAEELAKKDRIARDILAAQRGKVVFIDVRSTDTGVWRGVGK